LKNAVGEYDDGALNHTINMFMAAAVKWLTGLAI